jgi:glycosyltransferase involved in cell wall biosynthesis
VLIDAVAQLRRRGIDAALVITGEGPLRAELESQANELGIAQFVRFTGNLADVRPVLAMLDVFVLPSLYIETFSNAALEALAMRTPVVLSRIAGAPEMIDDGVEGYLIEPQALASQLPQMLTTLASDPDLRERMAANARRRVECQFGLQEMVDRYASIVERLDA